MEIKGIKRGSNSAQANVDNVTSSTFFTGGYNTTTLPMDPLVIGFSFIKWIKLPIWLSAEYGYFQAITEKNLKSFNGNDDIEISGIDAQAGFTGNTSQFAGAIGAKGQGFSMTHNEFSGSPVIAAYNYWVSSIRDPHSGIALYPSYDGNLEYAAKNHTGELLYVTTKPNVKNIDQKIIESATLYTNVMPTKLMRSPYNTTAGSQESPAVEMTFFGDRWFGQGVDDYAASILGTFGAIETLQTENIGNFGD